MLENFVASFFGPTTWYVAGIILILLEFALPGAIVIFLGIAALLVGLLTSLGVLESIYSQTLTWAVLSLVLILLLRRYVARLFPALERRGPRSDLADIRGQVVEVLSEVRAEHSEGRVRFQGSSWQARSTGAPIPEGGLAKIVDRENLFLLVEPARGD